MKFRNAAIYFLFQVLPIPFWILFAVYYQIAWFMRDASDEPQDVVIPVVNITLFMRTRGQIAWEYFAKPLGMYLWPCVVVVLHVGDSMLTGASQLKRYDRQRHITGVGMSAVVFGVIKSISLPAINAFFWKLGVNGIPILLNGLSFFTYFFNWFGVMPAHFIIYYQIFAPLWIAYGVKKEKAYRAARKCVSGACAYDLLCSTFEFLNHESVIRQEILENASMLLLYDYFLISALCMGVLPGCCKLYSMCFFGDFAQKCDKGQCSTFCDLPITSYKFHRVGMMHLVQACLKIRVFLSKFLFVFNDPLAACPSLIKDIYYTIFNFCLKLRPSMVVGIVRNNRKLGKEAPWDIDDSPISEQYSDRGCKVAQIWKIAAKYSVDWVPYWSRVIYPFSFEYPFSALRNLSAARNHGTREQAPKVPHQVRTGYYGCASFLMRVGNLPGFCCTDAIGTSHYRRYTRASASPEFVKLWTDWFLGASREDMGNCVEEYDYVARGCEEVAKDVCYSDCVFPFGVVPSEQLVQFQYVLCGFFERMHTQAYLRQGVKLSTNLFLILSFCFWLFIRDAYANKSSNYVCSQIALSMTYGECGCVLRLLSGMVTWMHVVKVLLFLSIDLCEAFLVFRNLSSSVHASHRRLVFEWGKVSILNQILTFTVTQYIVARCSSTLLVGVAYPRVTGSRETPEYTCAMFYPSYA